MCKCTPWLPVGSTQAAARAAQVGRNPRIVRYEDNLPTITLWQWRALGRPVHGVKKA